MMLSPLNIPIYAAFLVYAVISWIVKSRYGSWLGLADAVIIWLSVAAVYSAGELCCRILWGSGNLGDFAESRIIIFLGGFAVIFVSITAIGDVLKKQASITSGSVTPDQRGH